MRKIKKEIYLKYLKLGINVIYNTHYVLYPFTNILIDPKTSSKITFEGMPNEIDLGMIDRYKTYFSNQSIRHIDDINNYIRDHIIKEDFDEKKFAESIKKIIEQDINSDLKCKKL